MKTLKSLAIVLGLFGLTAGKEQALAQEANRPYRVVDTVKVMGTGGIDYVFADNEGRKIYVPRGTQTYVFDLDSHKPAGVITNISGHGVAIHTPSHHGFSSSKPLGMFDTVKMEKIKDIPVEGRPDGIMLEPFLDRVLVFSHSAPSITIIDPVNGTVEGTIEVGGALEQGQSDGKGTLYVDIEDEKKVAVVNLRTKKVTAKYDLGSDAGEPGGLALDNEKHVLFAMCGNPAVCVVLNATDGKIITKLPIGNGTDGACFNPTSKEAFSSQRDGTLTIIHEGGGSKYVVEQNLKTLPGCKTCSLDTRNNQVVLICTERAGGPLPASASQQERRASRNDPGNLDVLFVGR